MPDAFAPYGQAQTEFIFSLSLGVFLIVLGISLWKRKFPGKFFAIGLVSTIGLPFLLRQMLPPTFYACTCNQQPECIHRFGEGEAAGSETVPFGAMYGDGKSSFILTGSRFQELMQQAESEGFTCVPKK
jgi:hypothetical protein